MQLFISKKLKEIDHFEDLGVEGWNFLITNHTEIANKM
jgi:hypothetical protein